MPASQHCPRTDIFELKLKIERKLGQQKTTKYLSLLSRYLSLKLRKSEFDKLCICLVGRENISLHNGLIRAIIRNACLAKTPPAKQIKTEDSLNVKVPNGYERSCLQSICRDVFPQSPRKGRTPTIRDRKLKDRPSPLGPYGKTHTVVSEDLATKVQEQQSATELLSIGSRPPVEVNSVEEGEEVEQATGSPSVYSWSPVRAPFGVSIKGKGMAKVLHKSSTASVYTETCHGIGSLPDTSSLKKRLEQKLELEGLKVSVDSVNLLNNGLEAFMKRLIKPCLEIACSRSGNTHPNQVHSQTMSGSNGTRPLRSIQHPNKPFSASVLDFRVAMESNPGILGEDWPVQLEKICMSASGESVSAHDLGVTPGS